MKKFLKVISILTLAIVTAFGVVACGGDDGASTEKGLLCKKLEDVYTIYKYVDDGRDSSVLDLAAELEEGVTDVRIKAGAFSGNNTITEIIIPDTVTSIDQGAFKNMKKLVKITTPFVGASANADAEYGDSKAQDKSTGLARTIGYWFGTSEYDGGMPITVEYDNGATQTIYVPTTFNQVEVKAEAGYSIPMYAFSGATNLTTVKLSEGIDVIGENAFKGCKNLINVTVPASVTKIAKNAFYACESLNTETLFAEDATVSELGEGAFASTKMDTIVIPASVKVIGNDCFKASAVKTIYLPSGLEKIGNYAFYNCAKLSKVYTDGVNGAEMGVYAFAKCESLDYVGEAEGYAQETIKLGAFSNLGAMSFANIDNGKSYVLVSNFDNQAVSGAFYGTEYAKAN